MADPAARLALDEHFFSGEGLEFAFEAAHAVDHGVEGGEGRGRGRAGEGGVGGGSEGREDGFALVLDVFLDRFEVLAGEFVRQPEQGLVLSSKAEVSTVVRTDLRGEGVGESITRRRWLSALSLVVVISAMFQKLLGA